MRTARASGRSRVPGQAGQAIPSRGGLAVLSSTSRRPRPEAPSPSQVAQAPNFWLNVKSRGSGAGRPVPQPGQARARRVEAFYASAGATPATLLPDSASARRTGLQQARPRPRPPDARDQRLDVVDLETVEPRQGVAAGCRAPSTRTPAPPCFTAAAITSLWRPLRLRTSGASSVISPRGKSPPCASASAAIPAAAVVAGPSTTSPRSPHRAQCATP